MDSQDQTPLNGAQPAEPGLLTGADFEEEVTDAKGTMLPLEVILLTQDHEIRGLVYVSREAKADRRLSELLNDQTRRFLAIKDAELVNRHSPSGARHYAFLQVHIDNIIMLHPSAQRLVNNQTYSTEEASRFDNFRAKLVSKQQPQ
jgi:hypothetical protein